MGNFDFSRAAGIISTSPDPIMDTMAVEFGVPACALDLAKDVLAMLPIQGLDGLGSKIADAKEEAIADFNGLMREINLGNGIMEYDTDTGRFVFKANTSGKGIDAGDGVFGDVMDGVGTALGYGAAAWAIGNAAYDQFNEIKNCLSQFNAYEGLGKGLSVNADKFVNFTASSLDASGGVVEHTFSALPVTEAESLA